MKIIVRILLFPFSIIYGAILFIRNKLYDWNIFKSSPFNFPVIVVGNLSLGGTGKTPHIEYLIRLLQSEYKIATLSRGYKRKSKGFFLSNENSTINDIGDEPLQYKTKFNNLIVAVDEKRVNGIKKIKEIHPKTELILLDDAYQHRALKAGLNILITEFNKLYIKDSVIPSGRLREFACGSNRADIIIVSKTKSDLSLSERENVINQLKPKYHQTVYFSYIKYSEITPFTNAAKTLTNKTKENAVLLLTGIAKPQALYKKLENEYHSIKHIEFSDHHDFTNSDVKNIKEQFDCLSENNKIIITTEKDIMRLSLPSILNQLQDIPIFYIPIEICFHGNDKKEFDNKILNYVTKN
ncbi:MAG: tetraacyldisaccharide 4'-kinase [Flavobacteriales bacterium]|nr:MAG: tetraacyldisaccharide 4'-kinase [Flavobacteriales bacterium]